MKPTYEELEQQVLELSVQLANAESKYRELAAENGGLKADQVRIFNSGYQRGHEATVEGYYVDIHQNDMTTYHEDIVAEIAEEQTPATDAFLAEVRAQGVEMMAAEADQLMNEFGDDSYKVMVTADLQRFANAFAAQLRKGAAL